MLICLRCFPKGSKAASLFLYTLWNEKSFQTVLKKVRPHHWCRAESCRWAAQQCKAFVSACLVFDFWHTLAVKDSQLAPTGRGGGLKILLWLIKALSLPDCPTQRFTDCRNSHAGIPANWFSPACCGKAGAERKAQRTVLTNAFQQVSSVF